MEPKRRRRRYQGRQSSSARSPSRAFPRQERAKTKCKWRWLMQNSLSSWLDSSKDRMIYWVLETIKEREGQAQIRSSRYRRLWEDLGPLVWVSSLLRKKVSLALVYWDSELPSRGEAKAFALREGRWNQESSINKMEKRSMAHQWVLQYWVPTILVTWALLKPISCQVSIFKPEIKCILEILIWVSF